MRPARKDATLETLKLAKAWIAKAHHHDRCARSYGKDCDCGKVAALAAIVRGQDRLPTPMLDWFWAATPENRVQCVIEDASVFEVLLAEADD